MSSEHPNNAPGDYYVERDCCTLCGVPWSIAPTLFSYDDSACWVSRQPTAPADEQKMLQVIETQELGCIRYRGRDQRVIRLLEQCGAGRQCDHASKNDET